MPIVSGGKAEAVIVIPAAPTPVVRYAADELQSHIEAASGAKLEIVSESNISSHASHPIFVGPCEALGKSGMSLEDLPPNGFAIHSAKDAFFLAGRDDSDGDFPNSNDRSMGTLFAVYDWLDRSLGIRWIWPGKWGTYAPHASDIDSPPLGTIKGSPRLASSNLRFSALKNDPNSEASSLENNRWMRRQLFARLQSYEGGDPFGNYWTRFGKTHPEYFALRGDGIRAPIDSRSELVQMCVSNPVFWKQVVDDAVEEAKGKPERRNPLIINATENDRRTIDPFCQCEKCRSWDVETAKVSVLPNPWQIESRGPAQVGDFDRLSMSDRYARFWMAIDNEGKKRSQDVRVIVFAYSSYGDPPVKTMLNSDIIVELVPPYLYPTPREKTEQFEKLWDGWRSTGATMAYRPNNFLMGYCLPFLFSRDFGRDFKYAQDHGLTFTDFDSLTGMWGVQGPNLYMLGRLNARPDLSVDEVLDEYYSAFGKSAPIIRRYFEFWEAVTKQCDEQFNAKVNDGWAAESTGGDLVFNSEAFDKGDAILRDAEDAVSSEDLSFQERVRYLSVWLTHARLSMEVLSSYRALKTERNSDTVSRFVKAREALAAYRSNNASFFVGADWRFIKSAEYWRGWKE